MLAVSKIEVSKAGLMAWAHRVAKNEVAVGASGNYRDAFARAIRKAWSMTRQGYSFSAFAFQSFTKQELRVAA